MRLDYTELWATYRVAAAFRSPFHSGSLWRGVLGRALRQQGCAVATPCQKACEQPDRCAYSRLFDPPMPSPVPHPLLRGANQPPQPLVPILPPIGGQALASGDSVRLGLRVLGPLSDEDLAVLRQAQQGVTAFPLGRDAGRLTLTGCETLSKGPVARPTDLEKEVSAPGPEGEVRITFETPACLEQQGHLQVDLDFPSLFLHVYRRLTTVCTLYGQFTAEDDARLAPLRELAAAVRTVERRLEPLHWERHSWESDRRYPMHGLVGSLRFVGLLAPFLPYLRLGKITHIGKGTSFGLGRMQVEMY